MDSSLFQATSSSTTASSYAQLLSFFSLFQQPPRDPSASPESLLLEDALLETFRRRQRIPISPNTANAQTTTATTMGTTFDDPDASLLLCMCAGT
mmetsp:Transcript_32601/g.53188  ORF Transcript_32601/g.53188 Transcript_32601/m.53188 type:complete len:95 (+) Transcript_32601:69-353(+)